MHRYQKSSEEIVFGGLKRGQASPFTHMPSCQRNSRGKLVFPLGLRSRVQRDRKEKYSNKAVKVIT